MNVEVLRAGALTTIQDLGRLGHQREGVPEAGAMDAHAARLANLLVGNLESAALLEATLLGPALRFAGATTVALGGADFGATLDGEALAPWRAVAVSAGATLELGAARDGCRAYIAIAGGIEVPAVLGSRSTYLPAAIGGLDGRALRRGDVLQASVPGESRARRSLPVAQRPVYDGNVRLVPSEMLAALGDAARATLLGEEFRVSPDSDRMGCRLTGPRLGGAAVPELLSSGATMGTVQLPPGGAPIVLMADHQTTGGYPVLGHVATVDLGKVAQLRPGDPIRFTGISLDDAQRLYLERERAIAALRRALSFPP
ncbi:MAG TPA: biotin-dependent carboxyltransferase family protein [Gemmatimonadaceae bacterium]|nr:biotin-dependent carboxyltransferase family protein [Gemmatimonadaceae bacterium]